MKLAALKNRCLMPSLILAMLGSASFAIADTFELDPGIACSGFGLRIEVIGQPQVQRTFFDENGNIVRTFGAGKGAAFTFTNLSTNATFSLKSKGHSEQITVNPDGSQSIVYTGHSVVVLFPGDNPSGPSTKEYVGRLVLTQSATGVTTIEKATGTTTDICAALSH